MTRLYLHLCFSCFLSLVTFPILLKNIRRIPICALTDILPMCVSQYQCLCVVFGLIASAIIFLLSLSTTWLDFSQSRLFTQLLSPFSSVFSVLCQLWKLSWKVS